MKSTILVVMLMIAFASFTAHAQNSSYNYDWRTGNSYNTATDSLGNTRVRGNNFQTGSTWNTTIDQNGSMRGTDSQGNLWNYNSNSGTYMNYGAGVICTGQGYTRVCTGGR